MVIGNFNDNTSTNYLTVSSSVTQIGSYYLIDDVSVTELPDTSTLITVPNVFSPNDDEVNDVWEIEFLNYKKIEISIFNRWGEVLFQHTLHPFESYQPQKMAAWDGHTMVGLPVPEGVYYYVLKCEPLNANEELEIKNGFLEVLR
jgi:gliding motility-associated-like protein